MAYIGSSPTKVVSRQSANIFTYTATANQTAFTGADANGNTLACSPSDIMVHMNGIKLEESDFTASTTTVTLGSGAAAGDEVTITAFLTFESADHYTKSAADTRYVNTSGDTMTGNLGIGAAPTSALSIEGSGFTDSTIRLKRTASGTNNDAGLQFTSAAGANSGYGMGGIWFKNSLDDNAYALIRARTDDSTGTSGRLDFITSDAAVGNSTASRLTIDNAGRVTMPSQIGFSYLGSKSHTIGGTGTTVMSSSNVWSSGVNHTHNRGSHFNPSTGRFTCPVAGRYQFHFKCQASNFGSGYLWFYIRLNQSIFGYSQKSQENAWTTQYLGGILELNANDYVDVVWTNNYVSGQIHLPEFTGQLIG